MISVLKPCHITLDDELEMRYIMKHHGLHDWSLKLTRTKTHVGKCVYSKKQIHISRYQPDGDWMDTLLHEIAHALVPNDLHPHGPLWQEKCIEIGAVPRTCVRTHIPQSITYAYACTKCRKVVKRSIGKLRRPSRFMAKCCRADIELVGTPMKWEEQQ
jgi:hypothetical protein